MHVKDVNNETVDNIKIFGYKNHMSRPRVLRANGKLMRHGDLHYHQDLEVRN